MPKEKSSSKKPKITEQNSDLAAPIAQKKASKDLPKKPPLKEKEKTEILSKEGPKINVSKKKPISREIAKGPLLPAAKKPAVNRKKKQIPLQEKGKEVALDEPLLPKKKQSTNALAEKRATPPSLKSLTEKDKPSRARKTKAKESEKQQEPVLQEKLAKQKSPGLKKKAAEKTKDTAPKAKVKSSKPKKARAIKEPVELSPTEKKDPAAKLFENLIKVARQQIAGRSYSPLSRQELMDKLNLPPQHTRVFTEALDSLVKEGFAVNKRGRYSYAEEAQEVVTGIIHMNFRGFGFVTAQNNFEYTQDIFIPKHLTSNAVDGDVVEVVVNTESISDKGPEGKIVAILSRSRTHIAGIIVNQNKNGQIQAYAPLLGLSQRVVVNQHPERVLGRGDRVVLEVIDWGSKETETLCNLSHYLGHISDPTCDTAAAIEEFELRSEFPTNALKQANAHGTMVTRDEIAKREDLRSIETFTIDPTTAKDFDDALSLRKDNRGHYHLIVHIADVSHYIEEGSPLDEEARARCNSTYFPGYCLPMLPPTLSENLCSLKANVNRLTVSVFMEFDPKGTLVAERIAKTVIKSVKRMTYDNAKSILDGKLKSKHAPTLHLMVELCNLLKGKRKLRGSIEFSLPDLIITLDENGAPTGTKSVHYDITHQLVEEFMLKANEIVALHLSNQSKGLAYRIHDEPSKDNMKDFAQLANSFGFNLKDDPTAYELQNFFEEAEKTPYGQYLAINYIKRMKQALYSADNIGHYGLGLSHYCHFTSPIRRYIDLLIHRALFSSCMDQEKVEKIAQGCSEQERVSAKAENSVLLLKKLRLLHKHKEENPHVQYEAVVTRVKNFGFSFELLDFLLEGFVHVSELSEDYFLFNEKELKLQGRHTGKAYISGERITVMPKEIDFILQEVKWHLVQEQSDQTERKSKNKKNKNFKNKYRKKFK